MKGLRFLCLAVSLVLVIGLVGCVQEKESASWTYQGTMTGYTYYYDIGSNRRWEEDILHVAEVFLGEVYANGHPLLTDMELLTEFSMDGIPVEYRSHYDPALREDFLRQINELIPQIQDMNRYEILYALQKIIAGLGDLHSRVVCTTDVWYMIDFGVYQHQGELCLLVETVDEKYADTLAMRLVSVNGTPVEEAVARILEYCSYENEYAAMEDAAFYISVGEMLYVTGLAQSRKAVTYELAPLEGDGSHVTVTLSPVNADSFFFPEQVTCAPEYSDTLRNHNPEWNYWWEYVQEDQLLYLRINNVEEYSDYTYTVFFNEASQQLADTPEIETVVLDLRGNPGGYFHANLSHYAASFLNALQDQESYVLFDSQSYSAAIYLASNLMQMTEDSLFVGTPGGQPANFYAHVYDLEMPNSEMSFRISDRWVVSNQLDTDPALMPDVVLWQTPQDSLAGVDTVLEAIVSGEIREMTEPGALQLRMHGSR